MKQRPPRSTPTPRSLPKPSPPHAQGGLPLQSMIILLNYFFMAAFLLDDLMFLSNQSHAREICEICWQGVGARGGERERGHLWASAVKSTKKKKKSSKLICPDLSTLGCFALVRVSPPPRAAAALILASMWAGDIMPALRSCNITSFR